MMTTFWNGVNTKKFWMTTFAVFAFVFVSDYAIHGWFMASAYRRIGAACAAAGHSRFEEGSEHFWAYSYEHATGAHQVHGELIALGVVALSHVQDNAASWARSLVQRCGTRARPEALGITADQFISALVDLRRYARATALDVSVADLSEITPAIAAEAWEFVQDLPT